MFGILLPIRFRNIILICSTMRIRTVDDVEVVADTASSDTIRVIAQRAKALEWGRGIVDMPGTFESNRTVVY